MDTDKQSKPIDPGKIQPAKIRLICWQKFVFHLYQSVSEKFIPQFWAR
jgi:hypothetical protein